ncbi:MAG: gliding motility-associated-like protein, partial [Flavobacteriales bacterium]
SKGVKCETAHILPSSIFVEAFGLSTSCKVNDYAPATSLCNLDLISGSDYVLAYTAPKTFCGTIVGKNTFGNGGIMLMDACPDSVAGSCLGATACEVSCDSIFMDYTFQAGQTYYIVLGAAAGGILFGCDLEIRKSYDTPDGCVSCDGGEVACVECLNSDFETGTLLRWEGTYGRYNDPEQNVGFVYEYINDPVSRHTVMNAGGYDAVVGPALKTTAPEGGRYAVRLGNRSSGYEAETITYRVTVTPDNTMFMYYHAVVLNEPTNLHDPADQPFFSIEMTDGNGDIVGCVQYEVRSSSTDGSFTRTVSALNPNIDILWKDWTLAVVPLDPFIGETIDIKFTTKDCDLGGHFGYGYIDAFCGNIEIEPSNEVLCSGDPIELVAPPGFKDYLWSTGETTPTITVNTGGVYTVDVAGYGGACSATFTINVAEFNYPTPDFDNQAVICGEDLAVFTDLSSSNDTTNIIKWSWDFGDGNEDTLQSPVHEYDSAGTYKVQLVVETSQGCEDTIVKQIKYSNPKLAIDSIFHPLCYADSTGYIALLADSGISPYSFKINGLDEGASKFDSLPDDSYTFILEDEYGCISDTTTKIIQPDSLTIDTTITSVRCFNQSNGNIEVFPVGGTFPYMYNIDGGLFQADSIFPGLPADTFNILIQDINLCTKPVEVIITQPDTLEFTYIVDNVACYGDSTGSFAVVATGGTGPYNFGIDTINYVTDSLLANLKSSNYTLYTKDDSGCVAQMTEFISQPDSLTITIYDIQPSSCSTDDGSFKVSVSGGVQPYRFSVDSTTFANDSSFSGLSVGNQSLTVFDANDCGPYDLNLIIPPLEKVVVTSVSSTCDLATSRYQIKVTVANGDPSTYAVNEIAPLVGGTWTSANTWISNPIGSNVAYDYYFTDMNGCDPAGVNGVVECVCKANAGSFSYNDTVYFCDKSIENFTHNNDHFLESDEGLVFILHDGTAFPAGNIISENSTGTFDLSSLNYNTTYYVVAIAGETNGSTVNMADVCVDYSEQVPFIIYPPLQFTASTTDQWVCPGENVSIVLDTKGNADYTIEYTVNGVANSKTYSTENHLLSLVINEETNVIINQVDDFGNSPCLLNPNTVFTFNVFDSVEVSNIRFNCNNTNTQYQVLFDVIGGDSTSYGVNGASETSAFTSSWIDNGIPYNFSVNDVNNCNTEVVSGNYACNCTSAAGSIDLTPNSACTNDIITITHNGDHVLDGDDGLYFILHDNSSSIGTILAWNNSPSFGFYPGMIAGQTYYITALAGNDLGAAIDLYDPCLSIGGFAPVVFHDSPQITTNIPSQICQGDSALIEIIVTGSFGNYSIDYTINGVAKTLALVNGSNQFYETIVSNTTFTIARISNNGTPNCVNTIGTNYAITALDAPIATVSNITCNTTGSGYQITLDISGGDVSSYLVNGIPSSASYQSTEITSGNTYSFVVSDANNCNPQTVSGSYTCPCTTALSGFDTTQAYACEADKITATIPNTVVLDGDDRLAYFTSTSFVPTSGNIIEWLTTPTFNRTVSYTPGTSYYLFAVAGNAILTDEVDLESSCTQISDPKPFEFVPMPDIHRDTDLSLCFGDSLNINLYFSGEAPFSLMVDYNGSIMNILSNDSVYPINLAVNKNDQLRYTTLKSYGKTTCTSTIDYSLPLDIADEIKATFDIIDLPCHDATTGSISPTITGGFWNYSKQWFYNSNLVSTEENLTNARGGVYELIVRDQAGCSNTFYPTINTPPSFEIDYLNIINEVCYQDFTGKIYVEAPGSIENELYSSTITSNTEDSLFVNLSYAQNTNTYTISATNANGCTTDTTISIEGLSPVEATVSFPDYILCPNENAVVTAFATGGVGNYTYTYNGNQNDESLTIVASKDTSLKLVAYDSNGCYSNEQIADLYYFKKLTSTLHIDKAIVCPESEAELFVKASKGDFSYTYAWSVNNQAMNDGNSNISPIISGASSIIVTVTDGCGQTSTNTTIVDVSPTTVFDITPITTQHYCGSNVAEFQLNITSGKLLDCEWKFGDGGVNKVCDDVVSHYYAHPGVYDIVFKATDDFGCEYTQGTPKAVQINPQSVADFIVAPNVITDLDNHFEVVDQSKDADEITWVVNDADWIKSDYIILDKSLDEYAITQITTTSFDCNDTTIKIIPIKPILRVFVPNSFTPNQDGINGLFMPVLYAAEKEYLEFSVFDRWGKLIFHTQDQTQGWDGTFEGMDIPSGVYSYVIKVRSLEGILEKPYIGTVTLLR